MQRTIRQARQRLEDLADSLNPMSFKRLNDELKAAEAEATRAAHGHAAKKTDSLMRQRNDVLRRLCETRDAFNGLAATGKAGRISGKDYAARYAALKAEERRLQGVVTDVTSGLAAVTQIEEDPVAYADANFYDRYPSTRPDFTF